jgi:hypothetical protein
MSKHEAARTRSKKAAAMTLLTLAGLTAAAAAWLSRHGQELAE